MPEALRTFSSSQTPGVPNFSATVIEDTAPPSYRAIQDAFRSNSNILPSGLGIDYCYQTTAHTTATTATSHNIAAKFEKKLWKLNYSNNVFARWLLEIISWTVSALCMGAIITILLVLQDKKLPKWPVNLAINMLSRTASGALILPVSEALGQLKWNWFQKNKSQKMWDFEIFDNASRGPWGSMLLLIRTKGR
jgi:hypothetical protein